MAGECGSQRLAMESKGVYWIPVMPQESAPPYSIFREDANIKLD